MWNLFRCLPGRQAFRKGAVIRPPGTRGASLQDLLKGKHFGPQPAQIYV